jgi:hypothetical protein
MSDDERLGLRGHIRGAPGQKEEPPAVVVQAGLAAASGSVSEPPTEDKD